MRPIRLVSRGAVALYRKTCGALDPLRAVQQGAGREEPAIASAHADAHQFRQADHGLTASGQARAAAAAAAAATVICTRIGAEHSNDAHRAGRRATTQSGQGRPEGAGGARHRNGDADTRRPNAAAGTGSACRANGPSGPVYSVGPARPGNGRAQRAIGAAGACGARTATASTGAHRSDGAAGCGGSASHGPRTADQNSG